MNNQPPADLRLLARPGQKSKRPDSGSATLEAVIAVPGLFAFAALMIFAGRVALARQAVEQAAWDAAREASIARTASQAQNNATSRATNLLTSHGCTPTVAVNTSGFNVPIGQPATVTVAVACTIDLSQLTLPGIPGTITLTAHEETPLDKYRQRT